MKGRLTFALCANMSANANVSGNCKINLLLVYHIKNPVAFKLHKILKEKLHVMWRANAKYWRQGKSLTVG